MTFFSKTPKSKVVAVIDITSSSVGGALVESNEGCPVAVSAAPRSPVNFLFDVSLEASLRCTAESLRLTAKKLKSLRSGKIDEVLCVFSSPWFSSKTKIITVTREKPFEVRNDFFSKIIEEEEKNFTPLETGMSKRGEKNSLFIEHEVIKAELNGYYVKNPIGKNARSVKSHIYLSVGVEKAMEMARREIEKVFIHTPLRFATSSLVAFKVLSDIIKNKEGYLIIDIGGETTEINIIRNNVLEMSASFSKGKNLLFRKAATTLNTFLGEASSIVRAYSAGHRTLESSDKIAEAVKESIEEWRDSLKNSLSVMAKSALLPQNVFIIGGDPVCRFFSSCLEKSDFSEFTVLNKPFVAQKIKSEWLSRYFKTGDYQSKDMDIILMIEAVYADKFLEINPPLAETNICQEK